VKANVFSQQCAFTDFCPTSPLEVTAQLSNSQNSDRQTLSLPKSSLILTTCGENNTSYLVCKVYYRPRFNNSSK